MLIVSIISVALVTAGCAAIVRRVTNKNPVAILVGGLTVPSILLLGLIHWLITMEVDDAPPAMVILGSLVAVGITAPLTLLVSFITVRLLTHPAPSGGK